MAPTTLDFIFLPQKFRVRQISDLGIWSEDFELDKSQTLVSDQKISS